MKVDLDLDLAPTGNNNNAFLQFPVKTGVCKVFFIKNTLKIYVLLIETAFRKKHKGTNISVTGNNRDSYQKHNKVDECIKNDINSFILSIPKNFTILEDNNSRRQAGLKVIKVQNAEPDVIFIKESYVYELFKKSIVVKKREPMITKPFKKLERGRK